MWEKAFWFEIQDKNFAGATKNVDDCFLRKFEGLDGEIDAMMKDIKTLGDEEEEKVEDSTLDVMETQDEDVQGKEKKEGVVKLIETVVEEYLKDPKTENVEDENVKDSEAEKYGKNTEGGHLSCDLCSFVTAGKKRNSWNFVTKRHKIKAHWEKEIL